jgi:hypothetical protein
MGIKSLLQNATRRLGTPAATDEVLKPQPRENIRRSNPWHAVTILPGPKRCAAATRVLGERYLSSEAPLLPLKECTEPDCRCRYRHHDDRRFDGVSFDEKGEQLGHPVRRNTD